MILALNDRTHLLPKVIFLHGQEGTSNIIYRLQLINLSISYYSAANLLIGEVSEL